MSKWTEYEYSYLAENGLNYDSPKEYFVTGILGLCGCGSEDLTDALWEIYKGLSESAENKEKLNKKYGLVYELSLKIFLRCGITEHGGSVFGSWLTKKEAERHSKLTKEQGD